MDALPLSINQHQVKLMHHSISDTIADLQDQNQANQFASGDEQKKEQNLLNYGADNYQDVHALVQEIDDQLKSHLEAWQGAAEDSQPTALSLNAYQVRVLRNSIEHGMNHRNDQEKHLLADILEQLPEFSPQEQSD